MSDLGYSVFIPKEQEFPDRNFPTCSYANPEEKNVFDLSIELANKIGAEVCIANDLDIDRTGMMVKHKGEWNYLNGNQIGILILDLKNNIIISEDLNISLLGIEDLVVIQNKENLFITKKDRTQDIKRVIK